MGTLNCLSRFYRHAIKSELLSANPVQAAERPQVRSSSERPNTHGKRGRGRLGCAEVKGLYGDYVRLAASLGLRAGELTALRAADVDLSQQVVTVRQAYSAGMLGPPKWGRSRQVLIVGEAREVLTRRLAGRRREAPVLTGEAGGRLYHLNFIHSEISRHWHNRRKGALTTGDDWSE